MNARGPWALLAHSFLRTGINPVAAAGYQTAFMRDCTVHFAFAGDVDIRAAAFVGVRQCEYAIPNHAWYYPHEGRCMVHYPFAGRLPGSWLDIEYPLPLRGY